MKLDNMFKKNKYSAVPRREQAAGESRPEVPEGLLRKCNKCGAAILTSEVMDGLYICPKCGGYFRVHAYRRIGMIADEGTFEEWDRGLSSPNPLKYKGYPEKITGLQEKTNLDEAVTTGRARIGGVDAVIGIMDGRFLMASMGEVVGEKIARAVERATKERLPVIIFACSGGARMQEGIVSLMQMAKTAAALRRHSDAGLLYISVLTDPTTGGVTASYAMLGDIILAEPKALIGFAGPRVIEQTIGQKLPKGFQRAEFLLEHGFIDAIVPRPELRETLAAILKLHCGETDAGIQPGDAGAAAAGAGTSIFADSTEAAAAGTGLFAAGSGLSGTDADESAAGSGLSGTDADMFINGSVAQASVGTRKDGSGDGENQKTLTAWERVERSRGKERPTGADYINALFTDFTELHGDRLYGDDPAVIGGIARFCGRPVTVIAQAKGSSTKENIRRNFGMPLPEGYRKALRLMRQAEKFHRPVVCFVDTPGAFCGIEAEERGQGEAIARSIFEMSGLRVPVLTVIIGEGGSGGALAMATADEVWMLENSVYSILSPEGFASILWKDSSRAKEAADVMKLTARDLLALGVVEQVFEEPEELTRENLSTVTEPLRAGITRFLDAYAALSEEVLTEHRYQRFRRCSLRGQ